MNQIWGLDDIPLLSDIQTWEAMCKTDEVKADMIKIKITLHLTVNQDIGNAILQNYVTCLK